MWVTEITIKIIHITHSDTVDFDKVIEGALEGYDQICDIETSQLTPYLHLEEEANETTVD